MDSIDNLTDLTDFTDNSGDRAKPRLISDIQEYLDFSTDFDAEHLPNPYRTKRTTRTYAVNAAYKTKDKKVQPVNKADDTGKTPGGRRDWYNRSKTRDTPQE